MPSSDPLPPKESALFRKILKCYEMKQYKNGLKLAKQILSNPKFQEHGETLAMKGLTLNCLGRKEEAYDHVRRGLRNDLRSHVCWHVYGLLQRSDKKYDEAIKCYRNALRWEKDNIQILRDLSLLQIQMRDLEGYNETRSQLFQLRPSQHASWIGFAMSYHLLGDFEMANSVLETLLQSQTPIDTHDYKHSELLLYQNQILQESGQVDKAFKHLEEFAYQIVDKLAVQETMGDLCLKMGRHADAVPIYKELLQRNPENTLYYRKFVEARQLEGDQGEQLEVFRQFQKDFPSAICPKRLPLDVATGEEFRRLVDQYLRRGLRKGVPPLFVNMRSLYADPDKVATIESLAVSYYDALQECGYFARQDADDPEAAKEPASALLWTLYFLAQHFDHQRQTESALKYIDAAIEHTPTLIELFVTKGRIYKHAGDPYEAFRWLDEAQSLDTADRYINSKCAKYMLRANLVNEAEEVCGKFTREGVLPMENLNEMQCMWFQTECALAYQRLEKWGDALKKCHEVDRHFSEIIEDQFDFHTYCMRKMTLRAYVGLLRLEDVLRRHPFYFKAAKCAVEVYIRLYDKPLKTEQQTEEIDTENLPPSELKKLRNKQRKARKKAELESAQAAQAQVKKEHRNKSRQQQNADGDPEAPQLDELIPDKLARPEDSLEKAIEFLKPLQTLAKDCIETHLLAFEIYYRKNKLLLMLQSLKRAQAIDANDPDLHSAVVRFRGVMDKATDVPPQVKTVLDRGTECLFQGKTAIQLNDSFLKANGKSIRHVLEAAKIMCELEPEKRETAINLVTAFDVEQLKLEDCTRVFNSMNKGDFGDGDCAIAYKKNCSRQFPYAVVFKNMQNLPYLKPMGKNHVESPAVQSHDCPQTSPVSSQPATQLEQSTSELK
ncbi:N-alpha-acetyltransferase 15, NatA auxiliary subunit [Phlebotomus argentipes]|uniref:N-alpha-acetyltransferase 15, NatA auxiliary subunit n=1 Tax=Phlebotomus argentipes TaxID=94469 RepID=UPI0028936324|nr:N-alpha-acetyltransferase 15, NatA auxiliary subunit [Phlebotomus argentipes]